jgi:hypothetical protein
MDLFQIAMLVWPIVASLQLASTTRDAMRAGLWSAVAGSAALIVLAGWSSQVVAQKSTKSPTPQEYINHVGGRLIPAGELELDGRRMACGNHPTVMDDRLDDFSAAYPKFTILNPRRLARLSSPVKFWVYEVACGFQMVGWDPARADCFAIERGKKAGWLTASGVDEICAFIAPTQPSEATRQPPGPLRCERMRKCFIVSSTFAEPHKQWSVHMTDSCAATTSAAFWGNADGRS